MFFILLAVLVVGGLVLANTMVLVPPDHSFIVERAGRYAKTLPPGRNFILPLVEQVRARVSLAECTLDIPRFTATSRDGRAVQVAGYVSFAVTDARRAVYDVADYEEAVVTAALSALSDAVAGAEAIHAPLAVRGAVEPTRNAASGWGVEVVALEPTVVLSAVDMGSLEQQADLRAVDAERAPSSGEPSPAGSAGRVAVTSGVIAAGAMGIVEEGGRMWTARNVSTQPIARGARCRIDGEEGSVVLVRGWGQV
jgi:hypothetical protein